jgi:hypothetical protein
MTSLVFDKGAIVVSYIGTQILAFFNAYIYGFYKSSHVEKNFPRGSSPLIFCCF